MSVSNIEEQIQFAKKVSPIIRLNVGRWNAGYLLMQAQEIIERFPFTELNQINLTVRSQSDRNPYEGIGRLEPRIENGINTSELDYKYFNTQFQETAFFEIYQKLQSVSPFPLGRARLMKLGPKSCYSVHEDGSLRFHLPVVTNPECYFCFEHQGFHHLPAEGQVYCTNTLLRHTVVNGGSRDRIHFVISTSWKETSLEKLKSFLSIQ